MNLIPGKVRCQSDALTFQTSIGDYAFGRPHRTVLNTQGIDETEYLLGIRPEKIALTPGNASGLSFNGEISIIEALGAETLLMVRCNGVDLQVRTMENRAFRVGTPIHLYVDSDRLPLFRADDGQSVFSETSRS